MDYRINGFDAVTGQEKMLVITAPTELEAAAEAKIRGVFPVDIQVAPGLASSSYSLSKQPTPSTGKNIADANLGFLGISIGVITLLFISQCGVTRQLPSSSSRKTNPYSENYSDPNYNPYSIIKSDEEYRNATIQELIRYNQEESRNR